MRNYVVLILIAAIGGVILAGAVQDNGSTQVRFVEKLPSQANNRYYTGNRAPLLPSPAVKLPIGAIRPEGWLRHQLELMADGFTGHLTEISQFCDFKANAWTDPSGEGTRGWEEVPYWLKGFVDLGYVLKNQRIIDESKRWIEKAMATQRADGYFGPRGNLTFKLRDGRTMIDLWPNMIMMYPLRTYYEATNDNRVITLLSKYFAWQQTIPKDQFLPASWQKWRGGDNLDSIYWLYNRTGDSSLLELAKLNHDHTADWTHTIPTWHGVNITQCFREPAQYYQQARDPQFLKATEHDYDTVMTQYGQVPGGMFGADENARPGYIGPRQGAETCSMAEFMHSDEMLVRISGDPMWGDRAEDVAFNSMPASMTADLKGLHYLTAPNQIQLDRADKSPMIQNRGDMFSYNPYQYRCCQHNVAFGWPYYAESLWMATSDNGLAAVLYAASSVKAQAGDGTSVQIAEETNYPFEGSVRLKLSTPKNVRFPLYLRIPGWTTQPLLKVNGAAQKSAANGRGWLALDREWRNGDRVELDFPMKLTTRVWQANRNSVSIDRGPLTYSLKIGEDYRRYASETWPAYEVFPSSAWNYALVLNPAHPEGSIQLAKQAKTIAAQPFTTKDAPIELTAKARRVPAWKQESNGMVGEIPQSPVQTNETVEQITLIPLGCARLRISAFPIAKQ